MAVKFIAFGAQGRNRGQDTAFQLADALDVVYEWEADSDSGQLKVTRNGVAFSGQYQAFVTKTANYTVTAADSGTWFNTKGAGGTVVFTLPAVATSAGLRYRFQAAAAQILTVTAPAGTLVTYNNAAATSVSTGTVHIGHGFDLYCDGAFWYAAPLMYVTANTTVA